MVSPAPLPSPDSVMLDERVDGAPPRRASDQQSQSADRLDRPSINEGDLGVLMDNTRPLLGKNGIVIVRDEIHEHHSQLRTNEFNGVLTLDSYTAGFAKMVKDYSVSLQDELEWNVFYEKLKAMYARGEVVLHLPSKEYGRHRKTNVRFLDEMNRFEEECSQFEKGKIINDSALPYIMEEYQKRELIGILGNNYNFNTYRRLAFALELGDARITYFLLAFTTFFLQLAVVTVVAISFVRNHLVSNVPNEENAAYAMSPVERWVAILAMALYMTVNFFCLERIQLQSTKMLVTHKRLTDRTAETRQKRRRNRILAWTNAHINGASRNIGWWMDICINGIVYWLVIGIQIGIMFDATVTTGMVANSVALLFIMNIDDELSNLTDEQEMGLVIRLTAKRIFDSVQDRIHNSENPNHHKIGALCPLLDDVRTYIIPQHKWSGPCAVEFGTNGRWRQEGWKVELGFNKQACLKIEAVKVTRPDGSPRFAGPAAKCLDENQVSNPALFETWFDRHILGATDGSDYLSVSCRVPAEKDYYWCRLGDASSKQPELTPDKYVSELKKAKEIVPLTLSSDGGGIVNGVFIVKDVQQ